MQYFSNHKQKHTNFIYLCIYFSLFKVGLHVVKNCLTNKCQQNKKYKVLETVARFGVWYETSSRKPIKLHSFSETIRKSHIFWWFQGVKKSNNPLKITQHQKQNLTTFLTKNSKICSFTNFTATDSSSIVLLDSQAAVQRCSQEKVFWKYAANLQENTHAEVRFQ